MGTPLLLELINQPATSVIIAICSGIWFLIQVSCLTHRTSSLTHQRFFQIVEFVISVLPESPQDHESARQQVLLSPFDDWQNSWNARISVE